MGGLILVGFVSFMRLFADQGGVILVTDRDFELPAQSPLVIHVMQVGFCMSCAYGACLNKLRKKRKTNLWWTPFSRAEALA